MMMNKGNMGAMMKQMQAMQEKMSKIQEELAQKTIEAESGGGMVKVVVTGNQQLKSIFIDDQLLEDNDKEMLEDLIVAAVNTGLEKASEFNQSEMKKAYGGMIPNIPGLDKLF